MMKDGMGKKEEDAAEGMLGEGTYIMMGGRESERVVGSGERRWKLKM